MQEVYFKQLTATYSAKAKNYTILNPYTVSVWNSFSLTSFIFLFYSPAQMYVGSF